MATSVVASVLLAPTAPSLASDLTDRSFPVAAVAAGSLVVLGLACWTLLVAAAVLVGASSRVVTAVTPVALRRALLVGAAGALTIAPAHAEQVPAPTAPRHVVSGLALPDRPDSPATSHRIATSAAAPASARPAAEVRVCPGNTLWAIAARSLPSDASDAAVADATAAWHRANLDVIGADPDLIRPDQLLVPPPTKEPS
ncbi:hypothetical protein IFT73_13240 [Aeromicrobium sp. CFBP 8757]|uniref:LysM peptidoglycan-binding domain-containing protein n=1 Tax=Aeromicrobium sp. CFBP 8757 TaxID=2775288 RepID=UPI00177CB0EF|nr:hypothetical protein [Aeromicrobium sp. CFBP 8757]MBD8607820.1 hypothetical protein [Aeromicrobium sp. CFBP 8757]